jgi:hypothetical protein
VLSFLLNAFQFHCSAGLKQCFDKAGKVGSGVLFVILKLTIAVSLVLGVACW